MPESTPLVGIVMGSESDWPVMEEAAKTLGDFSVPFEVRVLSAHRAPGDTSTYAETAADRGLRVIITGAGGAAHLAGVMAASTTLPVIGVPISTRDLKGLDSLLSIVQMPGGVPVATVAIGQAKNAAILAVQILALSDVRLADAFAVYKNELRQLVREMDERIQSSG